MDPAGLATLVLGCPMLQPRDGACFFNAVSFGSLRAGPDAVALLAMKPCSRCHSTAKETSAPQGCMCSDTNPTVCFTHRITEW